MDLPQKLLCFLCLVTFHGHVLAQQPYIGPVYTNCDSRDNSTGAFGYNCNGESRSCQAYLIYRSIQPYTSVESISTLLSVDRSELAEINSVPPSETFPVGQEVIVPATCSCSGQYYQANASFTEVAGATYFSLANITYQGLSTCHALQEQNTYGAADLIPGLEINVPLRCACPTRNQSNDGVRYLLSYPVQEGDSIYDISIRFGVEMQSVLDANELSLREASSVQFFTTLLVPLRDPPSISQTIAPPPTSPSSPPPPTSGSSDSSDSNRTWVYVVIGVAVAVVVVSCLIVGFCIYSRSKKKKAGVSIVADDFKDIEKAGAVEMPKELVMGMSDIGQTLKVYTYEELKLATDDFSSNCIVGGSVYKGVIKGDMAAIKMVNGDVIEEVNLLKKINHFNLIRLSGVCFGEGHWYLVYEFAEKGPLSSWIHKADSSQALSWLQRLQIVSDVATGLNYLHSYTKPGYVHKDVNSSNILLDANFRAKVANFGMVRSTQGQDGGDFHLTRHIVGTKGYLAPEYLENGLISPMLDVYAFGVLMVEVITGKEAVIHWGGGDMLLADAFRGLFGKEKLQEELVEFMDPSLGGDYPQELVVVMAKLIHRCLQKDAMVRPSMDQVVQSLTGLLNASLSMEFPSEEIDESRSFITDK